MHAGNVGRVVGKLERVCYKTEVGMDKWTLGDDRENSDEGRAGTFFCCSMVRVEETWKKHLRKWISCELCSKSLHWMPEIYQQWTW